MKNNKLIIVAVFSLLFTFQSNTMLAQTAKEIAQNVYNRKAPKDGESDMTMTLINSKNKKRVRSLHQFFKDFGSTEKKVMFFKAPADVKNTSFLNYSYDAAGKSDDQWLYLPALKKVKRISASSKDNSFMGSDFTYEDMENRNPERDQHTLLRIETYNGESCYVVQMTPKKEEQYSKRIAWVMKDKWIPAKVEFYDEDGDLLKILEISDYKLIDGYWIVVSQTMKNVQKNHKTIISLSNIKMNINLDDSKFSQRAMQKGL